MINDNPAVLMAKLRWKGINKKDRIEEMRRVATLGWETRRKNKTNASAHLTKEPK